MAIENAENALKMLLENATIDSNAYLLSSTAYLLSSAGVIALLSAVVLLHFAQKEVSWLSFLTSLAGFVLAFGVVDLVPYDVWEARAHKVKGEGLAAEAWEAVYWVTFVLCWFLCPILIEYEAAGDFTARAKLRTSLRRNCVWYVTYMVLGIFALGYAFFGRWSRAGSTGSFSEDFEGLLIAAGNAWGLFASTVLMGFGLVAVPRHFWALASPGTQLQKLLPKVAQVDEARHSSDLELQDAILDAQSELANQSQTPVDREIAQGIRCLQATLELCEKLAEEITGSKVSSSHRCNTRLSTASRTAAVPTIETLAHLNGLLREARLEARRAACCWDDLVRQCLYLEDLQNRAFRAAAEQVSEWRLCRRSCCIRTLLSWGPAHRAATFLSILWMKHLRFITLRALGFVSGTLSVIIVLGQLTIFSKSWNTSLLSFVFKSAGHHPFLVTQFLCGMPLGYMVITSFWSVFRLRVAGWYGLYPDHNTDTASLIWCSSVLCRLTAPLCYHFLLLVRVEGTAFQKLMGKMDLVPVLGRSFNEFFPLLVAFLCVCNIFNVYSKIVGLCGLGALEFEFTGYGDDSDPTVEGRRILDRERRRRSEAFEMRTPRVEADGHVTTSLSRPLTSWAAPPSPAIPRR